jgi:hypothetical protein
VKRFAVSRGIDYRSETLAAETPREAAEAHVRDAYDLDDVDGSHLVTVERDGVVERFRVYVTVTVVAQSS